MLVAVAGSILIGEFLEAAMVAFLFAVSLVLESWSIARARHAIAALMTLAPENATLLDASGKEQVTPAADVPVGARLLVRPGEKFPLDGKVLKGESTVNQAPITGESLPVAKRPGDFVYAGTINQEGALDIESTKPATDTTLAKIIRMVGDAQSKRSPSEQWVEKFAAYYTPIVFVLALGVMLVPPLLGGMWGLWFYRGLVLLVIACPCALVISTPVSIVAGAHLRGSRWSPRQRRSRSGGSGPTQGDCRRQNGNAYERPARRASCRSIAGNNDQRGLADRSGD